MCKISPVMYGEDSRDKTPSTTSLTRAGAAERREPVTEAVVAVWRCTRVWMMSGETALTRPRDYRGEPLRAVPRDQIEPRRPPRGRQKSTEIGVCGHDDPILACGTAHDRGVGCARRLQVADVHGVMP
jgi:hypothetical protein